MNPQTQEKVRVDNSATDCVSFPLALRELRPPGILPDALLRPGPALGDSFWAQRIAYRRQVLPLLLGGAGDKGSSAARCRSDRRWTVIKTIGPLLTSKVALLSLIPTVRDEDSRSSVLSPGFLDSGRARQRRVVDRPKARPSWQERESRLAPAPEWHDFKRTALYVEIYDWHTEGSQRPPTYRPLLLLRVAAAGLRTMA